MVGLDADVNEWAAPELDCDAGSGERNAAVHLLPPEKFAPFVVPFKRDAGLPHATVGNPYLVPGGGAAEMALAQVQQSSGRLCFIF